MNTRFPFTVSLPRPARLVLAAAAVFLFLSIVVVGTLRFLRGERRRLTMPLPVSVQVPVLDRERLSAFAGRLAR